MGSPPRRATYADVLAAPEHKVAEVVDGVLHLSPRPASPHARAASRLGSDLEGPFDRGRGGPGGWILLDEPELHLGDDIVVPDLAGWRRARMPSIPAQAYFTLAPDWICEVLSPSTRKLDRGAKLGVYARAGVEHAWLVDPLEHTVEVLRRQDARWLILGAWSDDARVRLEPFDAIELALGELWADVDLTPVAPTEGRAG
ncbi:MAG: Uma2 family endonuclease [Deltaproteobacteria bacterium]|nr:Uma2 family endonuclease [Deltaproteobacteria bacterium]